MGETVGKAKTDLKKWRIGSALAIGSEGGRNETR